MTVQLTCNGRGIGWWVLSLFWSFLNSKTKPHSLAMDLSDNSYIWYSRSAQAVIIYDMPTIWNNENWSHSLHDISGPVVWKQNAGQIRQWIYVFVCACMCNPGFIIPVSWCFHCIRAGDLNTSSTLSATQDYVLSCFCISSVIHLSESPPGKESFDKWQLGVGRKRR